MMAYRINRYIVGCKLTMYAAVPETGSELIDT